MGIVFDRGLYYFVKRTPRRFAHIEARSQVRISLKTDSRRDAEARAAVVEANIIAYWDALAGGQDAAAAARFAAARQICSSRGFEYAQADQIAAGPLDNIVLRLEALLRPDGAPVEDKLVAAAILGGEAAPDPSLTAIFAEYEALVSDQHAGKSADQVRKWRNPRAKAVNNFVEVVGDVPLSQIGRGRALEFRAWWQDRINSGEVKPQSANKDFIHLGGIIKTWCGLRGLDEINPFSGLNFREGGVEQENHPFTVGWIKSKILPPDAFASADDEIRLVFMILVNTGCRPSEVICARPDDWRLDTDIPNLEIRSHEAHRLKTAQSKRDMPLHGASLAAARALLDRGGLTRFAGRPDYWSTVANRYLTDAGLRERPHIRSIRCDILSRIGCLRVGLMSVCAASLWGINTKAARSTGAVLRWLTCQIASLGSPYSYQPPQVHDQARPVFFGGRRIPVRGAYRLANKFPPYHAP